MAKIVPSKIDAQLRALAKRQGIAAAEEQALAGEEERGVVPWAASPQGLVGEDSRHLLLEGKRSFEGITRGAILYDPVSDEGVIVTPKRDKVVIEIGPLLLEDDLTGKTRAVERHALEHLAATYADGLGGAPASRWLVSVVKKAALRNAKKYGMDVVSYRGELPKDPGAIWAELEARSIAQPWGRPVAQNPGGYVQPVRRFVRS